jgi:hypothetical protein
MALLCHAHWGFAFNPASTKSQSFLISLMFLKTHCLIRFEGYVIIPPRWQLEWQVEPVMLKRKTFDLLLLLIDQTNRVVPKEKLLQPLWPDQFVERAILPSMFRCCARLSHGTTGPKRPLKTSLAAATASMRRLPSSSARSGRRSPAADHL